MDREADDECSASDRAPRPDAPVAASPIIDDQGQELSRAASGLVYSGVARPGNTRVHEGELATGSKSTFRQVIKCSSNILLQYLEKA